ncbi:hypothetical protein [Suttonella indologenes]|uniref:hypothetical protein n=1 Tax=Suttonella indologenes TaxID=13276 RepID=UPI000B291D22|nr:hypothetical protein [Suttonella indologenes]
MAKKTESLNLFTAIKKNKDVKIPTRKTIVIFFLKATGVTPILEHSNNRNAVAKYIKPLFIFSIIYE